MTFKKTDVPRLYESTYKERVDFFLLVYNPFSKKELSVLNKEAAFLFGLIDGKKTLGEIYKEAVRHCEERSDEAISTFSFSDLQKIFNDFFQSDLIYFDKPLSKSEVFVKQPFELGVWLHVTNQCNLRCKYCYVLKDEQKISFFWLKKRFKKLFMMRKSTILRKLPLNSPAAKRYWSYPN